MEATAVPRSQGSGFQQLREVFSQSNPRKRAYPYESATSLAAYNVESGNSQQDSQKNEENDPVLHRKRSRISEWPLKNTVGSVDRNRTSPRTSRGKKNLPHEQLGKRKTGKRISKFQEGSLNDKPSKQPPAVFIGAEDAMEQYHSFAQTDEQGRTAYSAGIEEARPLSSFVFGRFGKAVANVFSGFWKERETPESSPNFTDVDGRKAKAEDAYAILKAQGFQGTKSAASQHDHPGSLNERRVAAYHDQVKPFQDSNVQIEKSQTCSSTKLRPNNAAEGLQLPSHAASKRSISPGSAITIGGRSSSLHFRTPSFQGLKKVKSQVHIPSITRSTDRLDHLPHQEPEALTLATHGLSHQPSKKDLAKYQRLSKKVSNLESKLDAARRDLERSLKGAPPVPDMPATHACQTFTPTDQSSLPSESLLTPQPMVIPVAQTSTEDHGSKAISREPDLLSSPSCQLNDELKGSCNNHLTNNDGALEAPMLSDPTTRPDVDGVDHACFVAARAAKSRRNSSNHASKDRPSVQVKGPARLRKHQSTKVPMAPKNSPIQMGETIPTMPTMSITADEADGPRPDSPFLGRPVTASPARARSKTHKRIDPPASNNTTSASKKKKAHFNTHDDGHRTALTPDSTAGNRQRVHVAKGSPAPKAIQIKAARAKAVKVSLEKGRVEKPLPKVQNQEEFHWDDDVF